MEFNRFRDLIPDKFLWTFHLSNSDFLVNNKMPSTKRSMTLNEISQQNKSYYTENKKKRTLYSIHPHFTLCVFTTFLLRIFPFAIKVIIFFFCTVFISNRGSCIKSALHQNVSIQPKSTVSRIFAVPGNAHF